MRSLNTIAAQHHQLLKELNEERAAALRRISQKLDALLTELRDLRPRIAAGGPERERLVTRYRDVRREAVTYRWYLDVQREALGLRHHAVVDEFYEIPVAI